VVVGGSGKAADASWVLGELGIPSLALGFAAGRTGRQLEDMLRAKGVEVDFTWVGGETRVSTLIVCEDGSGQSTITVSTLEVGPEHVLAMHEKYRTALDEAPCVVMGGSLPRGVAAELYREFIQIDFDIVLLEQFHTFTAVVSTERVVTVLVQKNGHELYCGVIVVNYHYFLAHLPLPVLPPDRQWAR